MIFPGAGLWWLKCYWRACIFIAPGGLAIWYIASNLIRIANAIEQKIMANPALIDVFNLDKATATLTHMMDSMVAEQQLHLDFATNIFIACWLCSIASSYFAGKQRDLALQQKKQVNEQAAHE